MRGRGAACRPASRRSRPRCCRWCVPATMCSSPTAPMDRRARFCDQILTRLGVDHHLLRSTDRRRHRRADAAEHAGGVHRIAGLAQLRDAGHPRHRRSRACAGRAGADGQHLGDAALFPRRSTTASISSIHAGTKYFGGHSDVMLGTVVGQQRDRRRPAQFRAPERTACVGPGRRLSRSCAACARSACGSTGITNPVLPSRAGSNNGRRSCVSCIRRCRAIPATRCGSATSAVRRACSAWCSSRCRSRRCSPSSMRSNCSASAPRGAATRASRFRSIAPSCAPQRAGRRAVPTVRFHIGLEAVEDLIADLEQGFAALAAAG